MAVPRRSPVADLARRTGDALDMNTLAPVTITRRRKPRFVLMSVERYAAMTGGGKTQRAYTLDDMPAEMKAAMVATLERDLAVSGTVHEERKGCAMILSLRGLCLETSPSACCVAPRSMVPRRGA